MPIIDVRQDAPSEDTQIQYGADRFITVPVGEDAMVLEYAGQRVVLANTRRELRNLARAIDRASALLRERVLTRGAP